MMKTQKRPSGGAYDVVDMTMRMGLGRVVGTMVIPYMWKSPRVSDPYSPSVIEIVRALQHGLARLGYRTRGDGYVGKPTVAAMVEIAGPGWKDKSWVELYADVLYLIDHGAFAAARGEAPMGMGGVFDLLDPSKWGIDGGGGSAAGGYSYSGGVCKPSTASKLAEFKTLQRQINRLHKLWGLKLLSVDGRPGPHTTRSINNIFRAQNAPLHSNYADCRGYADKAADLADTIGIIADTAKAPSSVPDPGSITSPPSVARPDGSVQHPAIATANIDQYLASATRFASSPFGLAAIAGGVFLILKRRGKGKSKKRRTTRRKRR